MLATRRLLLDSPYRLALAATIAGVTRNGGALYLLGMPGGLTGYAFTNSGGSTQASVGESLGNLRDRPAGTYPATQSTAGNRPVITLGAGVCSLVVDGVSQGLTTGLPQPSQNNHVTVVCCKLGAAATAGVVWTERGVGANPIIGQIDFFGSQARFASRDDVGSLQILTDPTARPAQPVVVTGIANNGVRSLRVNGDVVATAAQTVLGATTVNAGGIGFNPQGPDSYFKGSIGMVCAMAGTPASDEIRAVEALAKLVRASL